MNNSISERQDFSARVKIGVFDSGVGGLSVANAIKKALPEQQVIYRKDASNIPYGTKPVEQIHGFVLPILQELVDEGCKAIVIACNTVTTNLIDKLREELPVPLIGMEPMIKSAAQNTKTSVIAVCATPRTLDSGRYKWLKNEYAKNIRVIEPDCSDWTEMIETNRFDREKVAEIIESACVKGADQIVLGCTHYHWIEEEIKDLTKGRAQVIQPEEMVVKQLGKVLARPS